MAAIAPSAPHSLIDPTRDVLLSPRDVVALLSGPLARTGRRLHVSTAVRWMVTGRLESVRLGGRRYTTAEALRRFVASGADRLPARAAASAAPPVTVTSRDDRRRAAEIDAAQERVARRLGVRAEAPA